MLLRDLNDGNPLDYFLSIKFMIFWWLLRLDIVLLENLEDVNYMDYFLIVNVISAGSGYLYFRKPDSY